MALICDTGPIYALYDADDAHHADVKAAIELELGPLFLPLVLVAEIDYLLNTRLGIDSVIDFIESIERGAFIPVAPVPEDWARCRELISQYRDFGLGISDASVITVAERLNIQRILTVDERHFRAIKPRTFAHFILIPADAP